VATAGRPANATPSRNLKARSVGQEGASAHAKATPAAVVKDRWIIRVRPNMSDAGPATKSANPSPSVVRESVNALCAEETPNSSESAGRRAWVL